MKSVLICQYFWRARDTYWYFQCQISIQDGFNYAFVCAHQTVVHGIGRPVLILLPEHAFALQLLFDYLLHDLSTQSQCPMSDVDVAPRLLVLVDVVFDQLGELSRFAVASNAVVVNVSNWSLLLNDLIWVFCVALEIFVI